MFVYRDSGAHMVQDFLVQIPAKELLFNFEIQKTTGNIDKTDIEHVLQNSTITITLIDDFKYLQEVLATRLPLSFFNDLSSMGEGSVVHSLNSATTAGLMAQIPLTYAGSLDLNSKKYLRIDLALSMPENVQLENTICYARQTNSFTNNVIKYSRLNVPDGVLTYEFMPNGPAFVLNAQKGLRNLANIDFIETTYLDGITSRLDFYELIAKYYNENEISSRIVTSDDVNSPIAKAQFESTILSLDINGATNIRIVRNETETDTTIVVLDTVVTSLSNNIISNGSMVKMNSGVYVRNTEKGKALEEMKTVLEPMKQWAVSDYIRKALSKLL